MIFFKQKPQVSPVICFVLTFFWFSCTSSIDYKEAEAYIRQSEKDWAESVFIGDSSVINRILADDFLGVDVDGSKYTKKQMAEATITSPEHFISNQVNDVKVRFYGTTAVVQGDETWTRKPGDSLLGLVTGRFVWTDTWLLRNGKWQIVAAEDLIAPVQ